MAQGSRDFKRDRTAAKKKPGLTSETRPFGPTTKALDQQRVGEPIRSAGRNIARASNRRHTANFGLFDY
ncbi:hypothetical protein [Bradyrhizobium manausense]|uniref:hypothetical protein n=1 Tax=Bradyrhizobium manausense TaxID=989370 RepID=UPI001BACB9FD|nr:hypothetical protein [Bradyrhizobium manausense]MBR0722676.1 hypothetical protein [Bradyrhizobium manausense]